MKKITKAEKRILALLADRKWHHEDELKTKFAMLQKMYFRGFVYGTMKNNGTTPHDRLWRIV